MILITGGIGSGKSMVSHILRILGYEVYDCDQQAKNLIDNSDHIKQAISEQITPNAINANGTVNRSALAAVVFTDPEKLAVLNAIVHQAVRDDVRSRMNSNPALFVETAIPKSGQMTSMADEIWEVTAPETIRIQRVQSRNGLSVAEIQQRIAAQTSEHVPDSKPIINDGSTPLLPQIHQLLSDLQTNNYNN